MSNQHEKWMRVALEEAETAMQFDEIPVASILVAGDHEISRGQTQVKRRESIAAHGELFTLLNAKGQIYSDNRPLIIYTTLEPCLMCLGACIQTGVDEIVFGMFARPDGGTRFVNDIIEGGQKAPEVTSGVLEMAQVDLMRTFLVRCPDSPATPYVRELLAAYE